MEKWTEVFFEVHSFKEPFESLDCLVHQKCTTEDASLSMSCDSNKRCKSSFRVCNDHLESSYECIIVEEMLGIFFGVEFLPHLRYATM
ncbi:hypothetical protein ACP70R_018588 [Stipagrostis hirtigluma subsp. patula]